MLIQTFLLRARRPSIARFTSSADRIVAPSSTRQYTAGLLATRFPQLATQQHTDNCDEDKRRVPVDVAMSILRDSFASSGNQPYFGEPVTHEEHALQCATLAEAAGYGEDVIVAALLHDIGHICAPEGHPHMNTDGGPDVGVVDHETVGKDLLELLGCSTFVTELVESHVPSKRYLVSVDEEYKANLAEDSKRSLTFQGGFMSKEELQSFDAQNPELREVKIMFRSWDEKGKQPGTWTPPIEHFLPMVERHLEQEMGKAKSED